jgi:hypothetical protein
LENEILLVSKTKFETKLSEQNNENYNKNKAIKSGFSNSLSFNSERDENDRKELLKISNLNILNNDIIIKDNNQADEIIPKFNQNEKPSRRKSNTGTNLEKVISPMKVNINKNVNPGKLITFKTRIDQENTKQGLKQNFIKPSFNNDKLEIPQKNALDVKKRKDVNGTPIIKGSKRHKLTFLDQKGMKFIFIVKVESYKEYNILNKHNEDFNSQPSNNISCCVMI